MSRPTQAYVAGLRLLARRELTTARLRERLLGRGHPPGEVDEALGRLTTDGALDDRRAARAQASTGARVHGRGRLRLLRELQAAGVDDETAREAVETAFAELDEATLIQRAIDRRVRGSLSDEQQLRRLHQYLVRLGFSPADALAALTKRRTR